MKKLKLELDDLRVATFDTSPPAGEQLTYSCATDDGSCSGY